MTKSRTGGGWNKGQSAGKKRAFSEAQIQLIRGALQARGDAELMSLALFETALSTMLRASDLLSLRVRDVMSAGAVVSGIELRQRKTGEAHKVSLGEKARSALGAYLASRTDPLLDGTWIFDIGRISYSLKVKEWARLAQADPRFYSTHSMRRTMASYVYEKTQNHEAVRQLLGHASIHATSQYLGVSKDDALALKKRFEI